MPLTLSLIRRLTSISNTKGVNLHFVPKHRPVASNDVETLQNFADQHSKIFVVTGAGVSTESGIPDYRSEDVGLFATSSQRPMKIQEFLSSSVARRRYWARNFIAWPRFSSVLPNVNHKTVREWELKQKISALVTQNVDGLHIKAGSEGCVELHGSSHRVICINCDYVIGRREFQEELVQTNPRLRATSPQQGEMQMRPDGDITIDADTAAKFVIPPCPSCGGVLKPDIVFFGDNVPKSRVDMLYDRLHSSDAVLVLGSSLQTFSAFRYLMTAKELGKKIGVVSLGPTRGDKIADIKLSCRVGELLPLVHL